jgi:hypothetical protein
LGIGERGKRERERYNDRQRGKSEGKIKGMEGEI